MWPCQFYVNHFFSRNLIEIRNSLLCSRRENDAPYTWVQITLPDFCMNWSFPFSVIGIYYESPFEDESDGENVYIALFTCARAYFFFKNLNHFELTLDAFCSIYSLVSPFHFASFHTKSISGNKVKNIVISKVDTLSVSRTPHVGNDRPLTKVSTSFLKNPR